MNLKEAHNIFCFGRDINIRVVSKDYTSASRINARENNKDRAYRMFKVGLTSKQVAAIMGLSESTIVQYRLALVREGLLVS